MRFSTLLSATALFELALAGYTLEDDYMKDFFGNFNFFTGNDPTEGFVKFVDEATAMSTKLISSNSSNVAQWGVDTTNKTPGGRPAVRLESKKIYNGGLIVLDVAHMPFGCGTWPAFWTVGPNWPSNGEIDIIEGVHEQATDAMTLHTGPGCSIGQDKTAFAGTLSTGNCDVNAYGQAQNTGCGIKSTDNKSYGAGLNSNKGGVYATEWTTSGISIYFFPRGAIPADVLGDNPNPSGWGKPAAKFDGGCDIGSIFKNHQIVFDTTFCGSWAGAVWSSSTCASKAATCNDYVQNNPSAFTEAYWEINALKVYQSNGQTGNNSQAPAPATSAAVSHPAAQPSKSAAPAPVSQLPAPVSSVAYKPTSKPVVPAPVSQLPAPVSFAANKPTPYSAAAPTKSPGKPVVTASAPANKGQAAPSAASIPVAPMPAASPPPAAPSANPPANGGPMSGFQWPKSGTGQTRNQTSTDAAPRSSAAAVSPVGAAVKSKAPAPKPTANSNDTPADIPSVAKVTHIVEVTKTVEKTVYVTDYEAEATAPAKNAHMARFIQEHKRGLTRHHQRR